MFVLPKSKMFPLINRNICEINPWIRNDSELYQDQQLLFDDSCFSRSKVDVFYRTLLLPSHLTCVSSPRLPLPPPASPSLPLTPSVRTGATRLEAQSSFSDITPSITPAILSWDGWCCCSATNAHARSRINAGTE